MAYKIIYKKRFSNKLVKLLEYLEKNWGNKSLFAFSNSSVISSTISLFIILKLDKYRAMLIYEKEKNKKFENLGKAETGMKLDATKFDLPDLKSDTSKMLRNEHWLKELQKDQYLFEAVKVLKDMK